MVTVKELLTSMIEKINSRIRSINGITPDEAGNVTLAQPDLSQNDPEAADYVKNRTHYVSDELVESQVYSGEITTSTTSGMHIALVSGVDITFNEGNTYKIIFNGTTYECIATVNEDVGGIVVGSTTFLGIDDGGTEPFALQAYSGTLGGYFQTDGTHTLSVFEKRPKVVELPDKFIATHLANFKTVSDKVDELRDKELVEFIELKENQISDNVTIETIQFAIDKMKIGCIFAFDGKILDEIGYSAGNAYVESEHVYWRYKGNYQYRYSEVTNGAVSMNSIYTYPKQYEINADNMKLLANTFSVKKRTTHTDTSIYETEPFIETESPAPNTYPSFKVYWDGTIEGRNIILKSNSEDAAPKTVPAISTATVGQTIIVKSVDDTGRPTEWEAVDMPNGGSTVYYGSYPYIYNDASLQQKVSKSEFLAAVSKSQIYVVNTHDEYSIGTRYALMSWYDDDNYVSIASFNVDGASVTHNVWHTSEFVDDEG